MEIQLSQTALAKTPVDLVFVCATQKTSKEKTEGVLSTTDFGTELDKCLENEIGNIMKDQEFSGGLGETLLIPTFGKIKPKYVLVIGSGNSDSYNLDVSRKLAAAVVQAANKIKAKSAAGFLEAKSFQSFSPAARLQAFAEGASLTDYLFEHFKEKKRQKKNTLQKILIQTKGDTRKLAQSATLGLHIAEGTNVARELVNLPANIINPKTLAEEAKNMAKKYKNISCRILTGKELEKEKMFAVIAVGQGSAVPSHFIHLKYKPSKKVKTKVAIVGKGITFDTGGYNIKTRKMEEMKHDMGGAAAVLGLFDVLGKIKPNVEVEGFVAAAENMISGNAMRPSDIISSRSGKTIEILNTDAEGRLVLADALDYVCDQKPDYMIDIATLTGGAAYALGELITPVLSNNKKLWEKLKKAGDLAGECSWELPLFQEYKKGYKNGCADLKNAFSGTMASTIAGALFLEEFVKPGVAWAHMDIAYTGNNEKPLPYFPTVGGTGNPVRTLVYFLMGL